MEKRTAFLTASLHEGTSVKMWRALASLHASRGGSLFAFPGGRLERAAGGEWLRNAVYRLVDASGADGVIAWASSLTGDASPSQVSSYLTNLTDKPMVTIGLKVEGRPLVGFDAYSGFRGLVEHLIRVHGKKRIACLRGPEGHESSQRRFQAYRDALEANGLPLDWDLVSSPVPWAQGREALAELMDARGLVPSLDFDALVCASDFLMFSATRALEDLGVSIPGQLAVCGFNDNDVTNKLLVSPPTTVRMPVDAMVSSALESLDTLMEGGVAGDLVLGAPLVVRRSCGCRDCFAGEDPAETVRKAGGWPRWAWSALGGRVPLEDLEYFTAYAKGLENPSEREKDNFAFRYQAICRKFLASGGEPEDMAEVSNWLAPLAPLPPGIAAYCQSSIGRLLLAVHCRVQGAREYRSIQTSRALNRLKLDLLASRGIKSLGEAMRTHLPAMGCRQAYLVMSDCEGGEGRLAAGFTPAGDSVAPTSFPPGELLPPEYARHTREGAFAVEPLINDQQLMGYLVLEVPRDNPDGQLIEDITTSVSSALRGANLLETANKAKDLAEAAERDATSFYANIADGLREPLESIRKDLAAGGDVNKAQIANHLLKAEHLLDLALAERGDLEASPVSADPAPVLAELGKKRKWSSFTLPGALPALHLDTKLLSDALDIIAGIAAESSGEAPEFSATPTPAGLVARISAENWSPGALRLSPSLRLAEKMVLKLSGAFHFQEKCVAVTAPWPTLSGEPAKKTCGRVLWVKGSDDSAPPAGLESFGEVAGITAKDLVSSFAPPDDLAQIVWDASERPEAGPVALNLLSKHERTRDLPFLCYHLRTSPLPVAEALSSGTPVRPTSAGVLVLGRLPAGLEKLEAFGSRAEFDDFAPLLSAVKVQPSLIVLDRCSRKDLDAIRHAPGGAAAPVLIVKDSFQPREISEALSVPSVMICNTCICESGEFLSRIVGVLGGAPMLPPATGDLVKNAIGFLNSKATRQVARWQIADSVNISEDYLTRIFKREMGVNPWDYLIRYRVQLATAMLRSTGLSMSQVASATGFQDQAYFCRVYKRITGLAPGKVRNS